MPSLEAVPAPDAQEAGAENPGHQPDVVPLPRRTGRSEGIITPVSAAT